MPFIPSRIQIEPSIHVAQSQHQTEAPPPDFSQSVRTHFQSFILEFRITYYFLFFQSLWTISASMRLSISWSVLYEDMDDSRSASPSMVPPPTLRDHERSPARDHEQDRSPGSLSDASDDEEAAENVQSAPAPAAVTPPPRPLTPYPNVDSLPPNSEDPTTQNSQEQAAPPSSQDNNAGP